jgi:hypothetical protein
VPRPGSARGVSDLPWDDLWKTVRLIAGPWAGIKLSAPVAAKPVVSPVISTHRLEKLNDDGGTALGAIGDADAIAEIAARVVGIVRVVGGWIHICSNDPEDRNEH